MGMTIFYTSFAMGELSSPFIFFQNSALSCCYSIPARRKNFNSDSENRYYRSAGFPVWSKRSELQFKLIWRPGRSMDFPLITATANVLLFQSVILYVRSVIFVLGVVKRMGPESYWNVIPIRLFLQGHTFSMVLACVHIFGVGYLSM